MSDSELKDCLGDGLRNICEQVNKPDFRELNLGSPPSSIWTRTTTTSSSSSSSSGSASVNDRNGPHTPAPASRRDSTHSGQLSRSGNTSPTPGSTVRKCNLGPPRSESVRPTTHTSVTSPLLNTLPAGNICPSGRILKTGTAPSRSSRTDVLGSGTGNYGHGSIIRGTPTASPAKPHPPSTTNRARAGAGGESATRVSLSVPNPEELKNAGNDLYNKGQFQEALLFYDRAISISPTNAACRSNRAAALMALGRLSDAITECQLALNLDPTFSRAHRRLASLFLRIGQVENARKELRMSAEKPDPTTLYKLQEVEKHVCRCSDARKLGDWRSALREVDAAIAAGADFSPQLFMCRVEALLKLQQFEEAESRLKNVPIVESPTASCSQTRFHGMLYEAYPNFVRAQMEMAMGRFDNAVSAAEKASEIDPQNLEVSGLLRNVKLITRARARGNDLFKSERFTEACSAYGEGLRLDPSNSVLYCNRAACWFKLGLWERSIDDCNHALQIQPNYVKALLRRAASNSKLEKWADVVRDYEVLRMKLPDDSEVAESLFHAQVALKKSLGEEVVNMKFGGDVEDVLNLEQFKAAISLTGVSVVHFKSASNPQCRDLSLMLDSLCSRYPSINFLKVDIEECKAVAISENVRIVPTFKIYKNGSRVKEIVCPSREVLEQSVRHYSF